MSKKKTKRKSPALRPPPLSGVDKTIYVCLFLASIALTVGALLGVFFANRAIAYADPAVIAAESRVTVFWAAPFLVTFAIVSLSMTVTAYGNKQPIFGKKGICYGSIHYAPVYPLFTKGKPKPYIRPSEKRYRRCMLRLAVGVLAVTFLLTPLSLCGRNSLRKDMSITVYSVFNQEKRRYEREDIETVTFGIYHNTRSMGMYVGADIRTKDGKSFRYGGDLDTLLYIKSRVSPSAVRYKHEGRLDTLIRREKYTASEAAKVRTLFGQ